MGKSIKFSDKNDIFVYRVEKNRQQSNKKLTNISKKSKDEDCCRVC